MINPVFKEKYNEEAFTEFIQGIIPSLLLDKKRSETRTGFKSIQQIAEASENKLDLVVFVANVESSLHARVEITKNTYAVLKNHARSNALVVYISDDSSEWRLSLITTKVSRSKDGIKESVSNPRRFSYVLGPNAKVATPSRTLQGVAVSIDDLEKMFSLEIVNKQFYTEVAKFFDDLVSNDDQILLLPSVSKEDTNIRKSFAVRLIGRIMFCWFLKQKKSENGQLIPDELFSSKIVSDNYYHKTLEPLFFGVLNTIVESRDIRSDLFDKVPYLNGGLFNPQADDYYELDRGTFFSKYINTLKINDDWFRCFFEFLETYNFTIDENTVFDQEISVDPEMLGRIFENLLAEINPVTGSSERKRTGSFYTPRQIVDYMVDQSLVEYLKTKTKIEEKKLSALVSYDLTDDIEYPLNNSEKQEIINTIESLKILDPACGSGAYPIGALQKIVYILQRVDPDCTLWLEQKLKGVPELYKQKIINYFNDNPADYIRKLDVIKGSIFGIDIQPIAVDVSRLRCFLTLVVEAEINDAKPNRGIEPLPNLDFKFVCANSLISAPEQHVSDSTSLFGDEFQEKLAIAVDKYFLSSGENKRSANNEIHKIIDSKVDEKLKHINSLVSYNGDRKIEAVLAKMNKRQIDNHSRILLLWSSYKNIFENKPVDFFGIKYFFPSIKDGFDIVIGNPPYVGEKGNKDIFRNIKDSPLGERFHLGKMDLFYFFFHFGIDVLKNNGVLSFITTNYYITATGAKKLIDDFRERATVLKMINFGEMKIFESALGQHNMITIIQKGSHNVPAKTAVTRRKGYLHNNNEVIQDILSMRDIETEYNTIEQEDLYDDNNIRLSSDKKGINVFEVILNKMQAGSIPLVDICKINLGCHITISKITNKHIANFKSFKKDDGVFVLNQDELALLSLTKIEKSKIKSFFKNSDILKYSANISKEKLIYTRWEDDIELYPNIKKHLLRFKDILDDQGKRYNEPSWPWFSLHRPREIDLFETKEKILVPYRSKSNIFGYCEQPVYASGDVFFLILRGGVSSSIKYLLGILNSKLIYQWLYRRGKRKGEILELYQDPLSKIPIKKISEPEQSPVIEIVDKILAITKSGDYSENPTKKEEVKEYEKQIDQLVYKLYDLTPEEIEIVKNSSKK